MNLLAPGSLIGSGYLSTLNARIGRRHEIANIEAFATWHDKRVIRDIKRGVCWSPFAHHRFCPGRDRQLMRTILWDKVAKAGGKPAWTNSALLFANGIVSQLTGVQMVDPREIEGLLDGEDRLLEGSPRLGHLKVIGAEMEEARSDEGD